MPSIPRLCTIESCTNKHSARGFCKKHYDSWHLYNDPLKVKKVLVHHGLKLSTEYNIWSNIKQRTCNPNSPVYVRYGGRGIRICSRWKSSFLNFLEDVGNRPSPKKSLDRIDNDGNYSCGKCDQCRSNEWKMNVRWATARVQAINQRPKYNSTGYIGVRRVYSSYTSRININGKRVQIGRYSTAEEAAEAYNQAAIKYYGEDAKLNTIASQQ